MAASRAAAYKRLLHLYSLHLSYQLLQLHTLYLAYYVQVYDLYLHTLYLAYYVQIYDLYLHYLYHYYLYHYYHEYDGEFGQTLVVDHYYHLGLHGGLH